MKNNMYDESLDPQIQFRNFIKNEAPTADDVNVEYYEYRNIIEEAYPAESFLDAAIIEYNEEYKEFLNSIIEYENSQKFEDDFDFEDDIEGYLPDYALSEYKQEQFRKEDSIEGPMSCFERGYYRDETSYNPQNDWTFEMEELHDPIGEDEYYPEIIKSEENCGENEYYQKIIEFEEMCAKQEPKIDDFIVNEEKWMEEKIAEYEINTKSGI